MKKIKIYLRRFSFAMLSVFLISLVGCELQENFDYEKSGTTNRLDVTAWEFIQSHDSLRMFEQAILAVELQDVFQADIPRTFIAPTNEAFSRFLSENQYQNIGDIPVPILRNIVKYHIVASRVSFADPALMQSNNPIAYNAENGQIMYLSHDANFRGLVNQGTNSEWLMMTSNLECTNGVVHIVSSVVYFSAPTGDTDVPNPMIETDTIYAIHDTYINGGASSSTNFGSNDMLRVKNVTGDGSYDRKAFVMFDTKDFTKEGVVTDMFFEIDVRFTHGRGLDFYLYSIEDTTWNEMTLTWDNASITGPTLLSTLITSKVSTFRFDITDFFQGLEENGRLAFMLDGQEGQDETNDLRSKEDAASTGPRMVATISTGVNNLSLSVNEGLTVNRGDVSTLSADDLLITGSAPSDIIYIVEEIPSNGWLIKGINILNVGDRFSQLDIDLMNLVYVNDGNGSEDLIRLSARDKTGASMDAFDFIISVN